MVITVVVVFMFLSSLCGVPLPPPPPPPDFHMKRSGMLVGNFWFWPLQERRSRPLKGTKNGTYRIGNTRFVIRLYFASLTPEPSSVRYRINIKMLLSDVEHRQRYQNPIFWPLSGTTSISDSYAGPPPSLPLLSLLSCDNHLLLLVTDRANFAERPRRTGAPHPRVPVSPRLPAK